jgi:hypothetical protein
MGAHKHPLYIGGADTVAVDTLPQELNIRPKDTTKARRAVHNCPLYTRSPADIASAITHHSTWSSARGSGDQPTHNLEAEVQQKAFERLFTHTPCSVCVCVCVCVYVCLLLAQMRTQVSH